MPSDAQSRGRISHPPSTRAGDDSIVRLFWRGHFAHCHASSTCLVSFAWGGKRQGPEASMSVYGVRGEENEGLTYLDQCKAIRVLGGWKKQKNRKRERILEQEKSGRRRGRGAGRSSLGGSLPFWAVDWKLGGRSGAKTCDSRKELEIRTGRTTACYYFCKLLPHS